MKMTKQRRRISILGVVAFVDVHELKKTEDQLVLNVFFSKLFSGVHNFGENYIGGWPVFRF